MLRYYWLVLCKAFRPSWAIADTIGTLLGLLIPAIVKFVPEERRETMTELVWEVPLSALLTLFIVRVVMAPWLIHKEQESKLADKTKELADRDRLIEDERASHQVDLHRAQTSDPATNAVRSKIQQYISKFEELARRAALGPLSAAELYVLEHEAHNFFLRRFPQYEDFGKGEDRIIGAHSPGETVKADEALRRCQTRLARLREALGLLS